MNNDTYLEAHWGLDLLTKAATVKNCLDYCAESLSRRREM